LYIISPEGVGRPLVEEIFRTLPEVVLGNDAWDVLQLASRYADAVSRGDIHEAVQVYAPDGVLETPTTEPTRGRDQIEALIKRTTSGLELVFQSVHLGVVVVDGETARARVPITEWARRVKDAKPLLFLGWYEDEARRTDGGWELVRRRLVPRTLGNPEFLNGALHPTTALQLSLEVPQA